MIPAQRRAMILDLVRRHGGASIEQLADHLRTSSSTVRRDLIFLTRQGYLERTHGGATVKTLPRTTFEPHHEIGANVAHAAKVAIGAVAASLVEDGQSVILDSSSTVLEAARWIVEREVSLTAVTNDLKIAAELATSNRIRLIVPGGTLRPRSFTLVGDPGLDFLDGLHVDLALIGIHALARQRLSETSVEVAAMKRRMMAAARQSVVLADSSKFGEPAFAQVADILQVEGLITDDEIPAEELHRLERLGVRVTLAPMSRGA